MAQDLCQSHECSNDVDGVLGDETLCWDAALAAKWYDVKRLEDGEPCINGWGGLCVEVAGTACLVPDTTANLQVRACNSIGCSPWSLESVEFLPFACLFGEGNCERPCEGYLVRRLEEKYDECP